MLTETNSYFKKRKKSFLSSGIEESILQYLMQETTE